MTPKLPGLLVRYIQQKRCVAFVGAGLSAGAGLPTWGRLLLKGIDELVVSMPEGEGHQEELRNLVERGKLLEVADFCKERLGAAYHHFLSEQVRGDQAELPRTHDALMHLPFNAWVTTNYDKLLERAYSKVKGGFPKTLTHKDTDALGRLLFDGGQFILKAHGDIDRPETVVLTSRDYSEILHANPAFNEAFSGLLLTKALLFVGYSLSDPDFRLLMDRQLTHFKGFVPERFALMSGVGPVERDVLWRTARIQVIPYVNESGKHEEVLHFLEALKAAVLSEPATEAGRGKMSVPPPAIAAAPPGQVRQHNASGTPRAGQPSSGSSKVFDALSFLSAAPAPASAKAPAGPGGGAPPQAMRRPGSPTSSLDDEAGSPQIPEEFAAEAPPTPSTSSEPGGPEPQPVPPGPDVLFVDDRSARVGFQLFRGTRLTGAGIAPTDLNEDLWLSLQRALQEDAKSHSWLYAHLPRLFEKHLPREVLDALVQRGASSQQPLVLRLSRQLARFPWELLPLAGRPLAQQCKLVRAPVGLSEQARGVPQVRSSPRVLLVEGLGRTTGSGPRELERIARLYEGALGFSCKVLMGEDATFARVMAELDDALPDLLHYTGEVGQMDSELYLRLPGTMDLSMGALRSVLSRGRLPFLVMNAPSSAFAPYAFGVYPVEEGYQRLPVPSSRAAIFEGREGFMELATQLGVGAFVGAFDMPGARAGADFMASLHRDLLMGLPVAEAVLRARQQTLEKHPEDPTALQYVLSGDGDLQLWDSQRAEAAG